MEIRDILAMLLFSIEFSDYGATIVSKLSLRSICSNLKFTAPFRLDRSTLKRPLHFNY